MLDIKIYINNVLFSPLSILNVSDRDSIVFEVCMRDSDYIVPVNIELFLEDYEIPLSASGDGITFKSQSNNLFRESFGYSNIRLFIDHELFSEIVFNVSTNEKKFNSIKAMMSYLLENNERVLDICFSRTKYTAKNDGNYDASFDSIISLAEKIVSAFNEKNDTLKKELRHRLELVKESPNETNYYNINPYDVLENLDKIYQGYSPNSLTLFGKIYSLDSIQRENHTDNYDLSENQILLGGLISIKETMLIIANSIENRLSQLTYDTEYKTVQPYHRVNTYIIEDLYVQLTTSGMTKRIDSILTSIEDLLYFFQKKLKIVFNGYIAPKLTPYARKSSFYLTVYTLLSDWYAIGSPNIGVSNDLTKIRSTSKIYELFTLYKLIDELYLDGWEVVKSIEHGFFKNFIPSQVEFRKNSSVLIIYYEKKILGFGEHTQHNDLVALNKNNPKSKFNFYNPDFLLSKHQDGIISYYILDSKYSSSRTLQEHNVLDSLFDKYFSNLAIYDESNKTLEKKAIKCVNAIHPFGNRELNKWPSKLPKIIPDVSSILLSQDENGLGKILDFINSPS